MMVLALKESVIPRGLLRELYDGLIKVEEALATIEELMDRKVEKEYEENEYVTAHGSSEIKKLIEKNWNIKPT